MTETIFSFDVTADATPWLAVNDVVMGGLSDGRSEITEDGTLRFFGAVSLENNGGFASVRSQPVEKDLSAHDGILLRLRGDGKRYGFNLRTDVPIRAGAYRVKFDTDAGNWQEVFLRFEDFKPMSFGVLIEGAPPLDPRKIRSFGFTISDSQAGPFSVEGDWIKATSRQTR